LLKEIKRWVIILIKRKKIINQCNEGPFHTLITKLSNDEFDDLVLKLVNDDNSYTLTSLVSIYWDYNRNKIIDYFIDKGDIELLLGFLDYCNDFSTLNNQLDQKYVIDKLLEKNDKKFVYGKNKFKQFKKLELTK